MTRAIDRACELEEIHRESALAAHRSRPIDVGGDGICIECEEPIDPRRLAVQPRALRCIEHQRDHERRVVTQGGRV